MTTHECKMLLSMRRLAARAEQERLGTIRLAKKCDDMVRDCERKHRAEHLAGVSCQRSQIAQPDVSNEPLLPLLWQGVARAQRPLTRCSSCRACCSVVACQGHHWCHDHSCDRNRGMH